METLKSFFLLSLIFILLQISFAQSPDSVRSYNLSEVVVTATRTPNQSLELANSITVIDSKEIASKNSINLYDLLNNEYGLSLSSQGGAGTLTNVYMRGSNSNYILVLVDGIELNLNNDPTGVFDFSSFPIDNIERIEILRGPQSAIYGSDAMAGIINIITNKGNVNSGFSFSAMGGSYKTYRFNALSSGRIDKINYSVSLSRHGSDGFSAANKKYGNTENDGYLKDQFISNLGYQLSANISNNMFFRYIKSKSDLDQSGKFGDDPTFIYNLEEINLNNETRFKLFDDSWSKKVSVSFLRNVRKYKFDETPNNPASSRSLYDGRKYKIDWQNNIQISSSNQLSFGLDFQYDEAQSEYLYFSSFNYESIFPKMHSKIFGGYILDQMKFGESFFITTGIRTDKHDKFGTSTTYQIAPAMIFWESGTKVKLTIGTGFKSPSLFYLYDPAFGNKDLKPEKSLGIDFGFEQYFWNENFSFGTTFFVNYFKEMFGFDPNTFRTVNINKAQTNGIEFFAKCKLSDNLLLKSNYTFTKAFDKSEGITTEEENLLRRPEHKASVFVIYDLNEKINSSFEIIYVGKRYDKDFSSFPATRVTLDAYLLINFATSYKLTDYLEIFGRAENILNSEYEEVFGYGTPGISFYAGITLKPF